MMKIEFCLHIKYVSMSIVGLCVATAGCASTTPYVTSDIGNIVTESSEYHQFESVSVYVDGDEAMVHGRLRHSHGYCATEGHVDVASVNSKGIVLYAASIALRGQSKKQPGWYGAGFRAKVQTKLLRMGSLKLSFHDDQCYSHDVFDCGQNKAISAIGDTASQ